MKTLARQRDRTEIVRRLRELRPDSIRRWGRMSAGQMVCHLIDALLMAFGEKRVALATGPLQRTVVKWIALYLPVAWPAGIPTRPEIDPCRGGRQPAAFEADLAQVLALVERIATESGRIDQQVHPFFGRMSEAAWLRWAYLHTDHHLRQFGA